MKEQIKQKVWPKVLNIFTKSPHLGTPVGIYTDTWKTRTAFAPKGLISNFNKWTPQPPLLDEFYQQGKQQVLIMIKSCR